MRNSFSIDPLESRRLFSVSLAFSGPQTITPGPTINVGADNSFGQSGMQMAVNPKSPLMLAGVSQHVGGMNEIDVYRSADGGSTWAKTVIDNGAVGFNDGTPAGTRFDPAIAFDDNGNLFVAYGNDTGPSTTAIVARSTDGGATFTTFAKLGTTSDIYNGTAIEIRGNSQFAVACGPDGLGGQALYVAFINSAIETGNGLDQRVTLFASNNAANSFLASTIVNNASISGGDSNNYSPDIAVGSAGQLFVVWENVGVETGLERLMFDRDLDGRFASASNFGLDGTVKNFGTGNSLIDWPVPAAPDHGVSNCPTIDVDRTGGVFNGAVYISYCNWVAGSNTDIRVMRSLTGGGSWTDVAADSSPGSEFNPQISVDPHSGAVAVAYYSTKNDVASGNDDVQAFLSLSIDGGATFSNAAISPQTSNETGGYAGDYSDHIGLVMRDGTAHAFWSSRHGAGTDLDAFTTTLRFVSATHSNLLWVANTENVRVLVNSQYGAFLDVYGGQFGALAHEFCGLSASIDNMEILGSTSEDQIYVALPANVGAEIWADAGNDIIGLFNVPGGVPVYVHGGDGDDSIDIGSAGQTDFFQGSATIYGDAGNDRIYFDDPYVDTNQTYSVTDSTVTRSGVGVVTYANTVEGITLTPSNGNSTINIESTSAFAPLFIQGHGGSATINIGAGFHNLDYVRGQVQVRAWGNTDVINVFDDAAPYSDNYTINDTSVTRPYFGGLDYSNGYSNAITQVTLKAETGANVINVDSTLTGCKVVIDAGDSHDTINVKETAANSQVTMLPSSGEDDVNVNTDDTGAAKVVFSGTQRLGALSIGDNALAQVAPGGNSTLTVSAISIPGTGRLDLTDQSLILDYAAGSADPFPSIESLVTAGFFAGAWTGTGIGSSTAAADSSHHTGLGAVRASDLFLSYPATFAGQTIDSSSVLIRYTYYGDANLDRHVDLTDFTYLAAHFNGQNTRWTWGDFNYDDRTDLTDFTFLAANFNSSLPATSPAPLATAKPSDLIDSTLEGTWLRS